MRGKRTWLAVALVLGVGALSAWASLPVVLQPVSAPSENHREANVGLATPWVSLVSDASTVDNSGNPITRESQIEAVHASGASKRLEVGGKGTHLVVRCKYDDALTAISGPVVEVLGIDSEGNVEKLRNLRGDVAATLAASTNDTTDGTYNYTVPDDSAVFALQGASYAIVGIKGALSGTGTVSTSTIEGRTISPPAEGALALRGAIGTGLPIGAAVADPGNNNYISSGLTINRPCTRLHAVVGTSGIVISLDGGTTDHLRLPANYAESWGLPISSGTTISVKRLTAGTAFDNCYLEVW